MTERMKTQASKFVLDPGLPGSQWSVLSSDVALACLGLRRIISNDCNVHGQEADFVVTDLSVTADRATVSDYTAGFYHDVVALITYLPDSSPMDWTFLIRPLHWHLYAILGCSLVLMTCVFRCVERCSAVKARGESDEKNETESAVPFISFLHTAEVLSGILLGRGIFFFTFIVINAFVAAVGVTIAITVIIFAAIFVVMIIKY